MLFYSFIPLLVFLIDFKSCTFLLWWKHQTLWTINDKVRVVRCRFNQSTSYYTSKLKAFTLSKCVLNFMTEIGENQSKDQHNGFQ